MILSGPKEVSTKFIFDIIAKQFWQELGVLIIEVKVKTFQEFPLIRLDIQENESAYEWKV